MLRNGGQVDIYWQRCIPFTHRLRWQFMKIQFENKVQQEKGKETRKQGKESVYVGIRLIILLFFRLFCFPSLR